MELIDIANADLRLTAAAKEFDAALAAYVAMASQKIRKNLAGAGIMPRPDLQRPMVVRLFSLKDDEGSELEIMAKCHGMHVELTVGRANNPEDLFPDLPEIILTLEYPRPTAIQWLHSPSVHRTARLIGTLVNHLVFGNWSPTVVDNTEPPNPTHN